MTTKDDIEDLRPRNVTIAVPDLRQNVATTSATSRTTPGNWPSERNEGLAETLIGTQEKASEETESSDSSPVDNPDLAAAEQKGISVIGDKETNFTIDRLRTTKGVDEAIEASRTAKHLRLFGIEQYTDDDCAVAMAVVAGVDLPVTLSAAAPSKDVLNVVLAELKETTTPSRQSTLCLLAVAAVALLSDERQPVAKKTVLTAFTDAGLRSWGPKLLRKKVVIAARQIDGHRERRKPLDAVWSGVTIPPGVEIPPAWVAAPGGIKRIVAERIEIPTPLLVTGIAEDIEWHVMQIELGFHRNGTWVRHQVNRSVVASRQKILALADVGLAVTSGNADTVVRFLADCEWHNAKTLPLRSAVSHLGWVETQAGYGFLLGDLFVGPDGAIVQKNGGDFVQFVPPDKGDEQIASGFRQQGTFADWLGTVACLDRYPRAQIGLIASFAAPLVKILDAPNTIIEFAGSTSCGKTTTLELAASLWGSPDDSSSKGVVGSWDSTPVFRERWMATLSSLPVFVDELGRAQRDKDVESTVYGFCAGQGRGRGSPDGTRRVGTWRTVMLSTGEAAIPERCRQSGARARSLTIWGGPFGEVTDDSAQVVNACRSGVHANHGHAGLHWIQTLLRNSQHWPLWTQRYSTLKNQLARRAGKNAALGRQTAALALLQITAELLAKWELLPFELASPVDTLWSELESSSKETDVPLEALRHLHSKCVENSQYFEGGSRAHWLEETSARAKNVGKWNGNAPAVLESWATEQLKSAGYTPTSIKRIWVERGWIRTDRDGSRRVKQRIGGSSVWTIELTAVGLAALGLSDPPHKAPATE